MFPVTTSAETAMWLPNLKHTNIKQAKQTVTTSVYVAVACL